MLGKKRKSRTTWTKELINDTIRNRHIECVMYSGNTSLSKSDFICTKPGCGYTWIATVGGVISGGRGCARCSNKEPVKTNEQANDRLKGIGSEYICTDYGKNVSNPSMFYHESCGCKWSVRLNSVISGSGCPSCAASKGEKAVREYLANKRIQFEEQYSPSWIGHKRYDFYLPTHNLIIEFHGIQHYEYTPFFHRNKRKFNARQKDDAFKEAEAKKNGVRYLIIPYTDIGNIASLIDRML